MKPVISDYAVAAGLYSLKTSLQDRVYGVEVTICSTQQLLAIDSRLPGGPIGNHCLPKIVWK